MRYFYDSHCHMMNLSHPNLSAIIKRIYNDSIKPLLLKYSVYLKAALLLLLFVIPVVVITLLLTGHFVVIKWILYAVSLIAVILFVFVVVKFGDKKKREIEISKIKSNLLDKVKEKLANVMNLLAAMETDIGDCLIQMEEELRKKIPLNNVLVISGNGEKKEYDKIVLTPLIMDFGLKDSGKTNLIYKVRWKPIVAQVEDLCIGIRDYYLYRDKYITGHAEPLFQIIPFMGINTQNYYSEKDNTTGKSISVSLVQLLDKNFSEFKYDTSPQMRRKKIDAVNWRQFNGDIESIGSYYFLGIKVYPPLGFDPWPEDDIERAKVCYLYQYCIDHNIPITAHCSPGGFLVDDDFKNFSSPYKWEQVLDYTDEKNNKPFERLRLNLAHFGGADSKVWRKKIADMILKKDTVSSKYKYENLYTDISYQGVDKKSYDALKDLLDRYDSAERARLIERLIFGSDFMINLQDINSYSQYLDFFFKTNALTLEEKDMLCNKNAERFLFVG
ncbi:amidohydrolase family protein [Chlorobaculum tepidum]|nr:amidohydrolase family protein [Chlorobaculum tepidum]